MKPTRNRPKVPGAYWWRGSVRVKWEPCLVEPDDTGELLVWWVDGQHWPVNRTGGWWAGPWPVPEEAEEKDA